MTKRLSNEDRSAVDVLLDRMVGGRSNGNGNGGNGHGNGGGKGVATQPRVQAAERVLNLLSNLPANDPPVDLLARTMRRIETTPRHMPAVHQPQPTTYANRQQPHA